MWLLRGYHYEPHSHASVVRSGNHYSLQWLPPQSAVAAIAMCECSPHSYTTAAHSGSKDVPMPLTSCFLTDSSGNSQLCALWTWEQSWASASYQTSWKPFPGTTSVVAQWYFQVFIGKWGYNQSKPIGKHKKIRCSTGPAPVPSPFG